MPSIETFHRHDAAVLWQYMTRDEYGEPVFAEPVELMVRWEVGQAGFYSTGGRREVLDERTQSTADEAILVLDRSVPVGSLFWKGTLTEWLGHGTGSGAPDDERVQVIIMSEIPDLKGRYVRRIATCMRFRTEDTAEG